MDKKIPGTEEAGTDFAPVSTSDEAPIGVRRVNGMPLVIVGGVLVVFIVLVAMVAAQRGDRSSKQPEAKAAALPENSQLLEQMLAGAALGGIVPDPDERVPSFPVARVTDTESPPSPPLSADGGESGATTDDPVAKERMKLFQTAMRARTGVASGAPREPRPVEEKPKSEEGAEPASASATEGRDERIPVSAEGDYASYGRKRDKEDRWLLDETVEKPRTAYEVRAGSVIPATMISGINSELPGQIVAQVSQDVFDTPTGRHRLVPQGSKLIGRYNHRVVMGQSRVLVAWQRIVFPDGKALDIGSMEGTDGAGYAGFGDKVNNHYIRLFGSAILMSGITAGLTSSKVDPSNDPFGSSNAATLSQNLAQQIGEVATKMIERNMNIAPTLKIRPGYRFNVMAVKDLTFRRPYQPFDY